jgi:hypothetical protein
MGVAKVTTLQTIGIGRPKLSPSLEAESSSLGDSSRMACSDNDPLRFDIEDEHVLEWGERRAREVHVVKGEMDLVPPT